MPLEGQNDVCATVRSTPAEVSAPKDIEPGDKASRAVLATVAEGLRRLHLHHPLATQGQVEGVHGMRTATRRLRSALRTFRDLIVEDWGRPLETELHWLAEVLGQVRDLDVLDARLHEAAGESVEVLSPLFQSLAARHQTASADLRAALAGARYQAMVAHIGEALAHPSFNEKADQPCREALPPLVAGAWKSLKKRGRALGPGDPDDDFHDVRKRAKRVRYAAEAVASALDSRCARDARRFAKRATHVQDVLGEFQDAIVAGEEIARVVAEHPNDGRFNLAAGRLLERQATAAEQARDRFFKVWDRLDRRACRRWLRP